MSQERFQTGSLPEAFLQMTNETPASIQEYIEQLGGSGPAQQHMNTTEDRQFYDQCCHFFDVPTTPSNNIKVRAMIKFPTMTRTLKPHQLYRLWWMLKFWTNTC